MFCLEFHMSISQRMVCYEHMSNFMRLFRHWHSDVKNQRCERKSRTRNKHVERFCFSKFLENSTISYWPLLSQPRVLAHYTDESVFAPRCRSARSKKIPKYSSPKKVATFAGPEIIPPKWLKKRFSPWNSMFSYACSIGHDLLTILD